MQQFQQQPRVSRESGFTFAELAFAMVVMVVGAVVLINHMTVNYSETKTQKDRVFAFTKAQAILAEIQAYVDRGAISAAIDLDALDDGVVNKPSLTIAEDPSTGSLVTPEHPLSGNYQNNANWIWSRRITVRPFQGLNNRNVRYVTVRIYKRDQNGVDRSVASLSSVVNSVGSAFPTTQVFDVYLLAVENIPGWWVFMEAIIPFVESAITDIESRNPGLKMRTHWITKASFGRNEMYRPYVNDTTDSVQPVDDVYFYPGRMPAGNSSTYYYVPDLMKARLNFDGTERGGYDDPLNPYPYALADFYNHAMRYPRERELHDLRVAAVEAKETEIALAQAASLPTPASLYDMDKEPTLRLFLEDLNTDPDKYRNALVINLHGELLPMPSLRNYSDPAKCPDLFPTDPVRVVTHPEELRTLRDPGGAGIDDVQLRVYAYMNDPLYDPKAVGSIDMLPDTSPIALQVMGVDLTDSSNPGGLITGAYVLDMQGGIMVDGTDDAYKGFNKSIDAPGLTNEPYYNVSFVDPGVGQDAYTLFLLYNTPLTCQVDSGATGGLDNTTRARLYGLEYIPSCTEDELDFSRDLADSNTGEPRNTARWKITVPSECFTNARFVDRDKSPGDVGYYYDPGQDVVLTVRTRIWDPGLSTLPTAMIPTPRALETGVMWPDADRLQPENLSETYTWWADSPDDVPVTERSQFQGDPRHNPYKDLWSDTGTNTFTPEFEHGYNWFHDSLANNSEAGYDDYPGIDDARLRNRWQGMMRQDVPRFFKLLRDGLINANAVYTTLTGFSYYYMGHGNEIGYDSANGYPSSIPVNIGPWSTAGNTGQTNISNITGWRNYVMNGDWPNYWWGMNWLGELFPDSAYSQWSDTTGGTLPPRGNLQAAGWAVDRFFRFQDAWIYQNSNNLSYGTMMHDAEQRTATKGSTSFFNIDNGPGRFEHLFSGGNGNLVGAGLDIGSNYNYPIPSQAPINRPWLVTSTTSAPDEAGYAPYSTDRCTANIIKTYYDHPTSGETGAGLVELVNSGNTDAAYIVVNGISNAVASGSSFIAKWSLLTMVQSFLEVGDTSLAHRIKMPPRAEIQSPTEITELTNPTSIPVQWDVFWVRWDGQAYTSSTISGFSESESELEYVVMYSNDNGVTWYYCQDDTLATAGTKPTDPTYLVADSGGGAETYTWTTPSATFPEGSYLLRVETYRTNQALHYSQHQVKVFIAR